MKNIIKSTILGGILALSYNADAALVGFVNNPSSNSTDWSTAALGSGLAINSNVNFEAHQLGALNGSIYQVSDGVTLSGSGAVGDVRFGAGPSNGNNVAPVVNPGEGPHPDSNFLFGGPGLWSLTVSFDSAVAGFGLDIIDFFGSTLAPNERLTLEAFTDVNGSGSSLGLFDSFNQNYQTDNIYFMGLLSNSNDIRSVIFTDIDGGSSDSIGVDDLVFAVSPIPLPAAVWLFGTAILGLIGFSRRRQTA